MDPPMSRQVTSEELQQVAKDAADQAVADAEKLVEAVMQETVRLLRPEFADLATIKDEMASLKQAVAKLTEQQLDFAIKEQVDQQFANLLANCSQIKDDIAVRPNAAHDDKIISDLQAHTSQITVENSKEQLAELKAQMQEMRAKLERSSVQPDSITRSEFEASKETISSALQAQWTSEFNAELSKIKSFQASTLKEMAAKDYVDKQITGLRACVCQIKREPVSEHLPSDIVTRSDLEVVKTVTLSELRGHKEHFDNKILQIQRQIFDTSKLQSHLSKMKREEEASLTEMRGHCEANKKKNVDNLMSDPRSRVSQIQEHLAQHADKPVTRSDLDAMREFLISRVSTRGDFDMLVKEASEENVIAAASEDIFVAKKKTLEDGVVCKFFTEPCRTTDL